MLRGAILVVSMAILLCCSINDVKAFLTQKDSVCYHGLGCFSSSGPFTDDARLSAIPSSPDDMRTDFVLYTRDQRKIGAVLDARDLDNIKTTWHNFKNRQTQVMVHGYLDDYNLTPWMKEMKDAFLVNGDYNTIIVDWHHGNQFPYTQAAANTRIVGAQMALLVKQLVSDFNMTASQFHIIGHSLGSHIAGHAGERIPGLGRITGLDPAGPFFEGTDKVVRLDPTDADFVDAIHTDGDPPIQLGMGTQQQMGHLDFYPNQGRNQPGCTRNPIKNVLNWGLVGGATQTIACDHHRAIAYFTESINTKCPFMAFPCASGEDYAANKCNTCPSGGCASMGFHADKHKPTTGNSLKYYTTTATATPFCQYHLDVKIIMSTTSGSRDERGTIKIKLHGTISTEWIVLNEDALMFHPGETYEWSVGVAKDIGVMNSIEIQWHHSSSASDPTTWNPFGIRDPKLYLDTIQFVEKEQRKTIKYCAEDAGAKNNKSLFIFRTC